VLLPLATKLRGAARRSALTRELIIEGMTAVQEGLNPRVIEQKLRGFLVVTEQNDAARKVA
jgi:chemotaxis protein MotA